ncbi:hypothetical protein Tco_0011603 [Tanacetum coccineum]
MDQRDTLIRDLDFRVVRRGDRDGGVSDDDGCGDDSSGVVVAGEMEAEMMVVARWRGAVVVAEEVASVAGRGGDGSEGGGEMVFVVMAAVAVPLLQSWYPGVSQNLDDSSILLHPLQLALDVSLSFNRFELLGVNGKSLLIGLVPVLVTNISQKDKNKAKQTKPSTGMGAKERGKSKPKAYTSLNGPTRRVSNPSGLHWLMETWKEDQRPRSDD